MQSSSSTSVRTLKRVASKSLTRLPHKFRKVSSRHSSSDTPKYVRQLSTSPQSPPALVRTPSSKDFYNISEVVIAGAPLGYGQPKVGVETAPEQIRNSGLLGRLADIGWRVDDHGDLELPTHTPGSKIGSYEMVGEAGRIIADHVYSTCMSGKFALTLGGDHSVAFGTIAGAIKANPNTRIVWVDAHADLNTPETSPSGNLHGMPLSFQTRLADPGKYPDLEWMLDYPQLPFENLIYIGLRALDEGEKRFIIENEIPAFTMFNVDHLGIGRVMEMTMELVGDNPIHLSFDIDGCDPFFAPSTGTPYGGGLTLREALFISEYCASTSRLTSMDLVEVNPRVQTKNAKETLDFAKSIISAAMGETIL